MVRIRRTAVAGLILIAGMGLARRGWAQERPAVPVDEAIRLDEYLNRLDEWRAQGRITPAESAQARHALQAAIVAGDRSVRIPLDATGRIDLLALARGKSIGDDASAPPADRLASRVVNEFELRMQLKARDMANPANLMLFDAAPGFVGVPTRDLGRIVTGVLETTPLREMPGGTHLAGAIGSLPNVTGANDEHTFKELSRLVGKRQGDLLQSRVGRFVASHRLEAGLLAFGAITGLRMASPETARAVDRFGLRVRLGRRSTRDARLYTTSRLVYRSGHTLPELELEGGARRVAGSMTLRTTVAGVLGAQASQNARSRIATGARWELGRLFADTSATFAFPEHLMRTELRGGYLTEMGFALSSALAATFGHGSGAIGQAPGRLSYELDVTKSLVVGRARGETGLFISTCADSDFNHRDGRGGLVFRLRF